MRAPPARISALLASAALFSFSSAAQPAPAQASRVEREIAITGEANEPPAVVYGAPYLPLVVRFDAPLKKDEAVAVQGADVRAHPFIANALVITPSSSLAGAQGTVPVLVPLVDGVVDLALAFSTEKTDAIVRVVRRRASATPPVLTEGELQELASFALETAFDHGTCAKAGAAAIPREVIQSGDDGRGGRLVCGGGAFAYMRLTARADCTPAAARLTRGQESTDVLLVQKGTGQCESKDCWLVVAKAPLSDGIGFELEFLAEDGRPCDSRVVDLKPHSP